LEDVLSHGVALDTRSQEGQELAVVLREQVIAGPRRAHGLQAWHTTPATARAPRHAPGAAFPRALLSRGRSKGLGGRERLRRSGAEAVDGELGRLTGLHVDEDVVVVFSRALALPVLVGRVARRDLDARSTGEDRILLGATAAQHQVLDAVHVEEL